MQAFRKSVTVPVGICLALLAAPALLPAQVVPPPGVDAARPPTERTLRPSGKAQNRERVLLSQDCRKAEEDMRAQYRIQADAVREQYASRIAKAEAGAHAGLEAERDAKLRELKSQGEAAAKRFGDHCREDNHELLRAPSPIEGR